MDTLFPLIAMHHLDRSYVIVGFFLKLPRSPTYTPRNITTTPTHIASVKETYVPRHIAMSKGYQNATYMELESIINTYITITHQ